MSDEVPPHATEPSATEQGAESSTPRRRPWWLAALAAIVTFLAIVGLYARQSNESAALDTPAAPGGLFQADQARGTSLVGVGRVAGLAEPCTAWLLDVGATGAQQAYAVTSGRCAGVADSNAILTDVPVSDATVEFNTFASLTTTQSVDPVVADIDEVVWASARGVDLAVVQLGLSYDELAAAGVDPITAAAQPDQGTKVLIAGVPVEGISAAEQHLRGSLCPIGSTTDIAESPWYFTGMASVDCAGMLGGSAGSPAFNEQGEAVGMMTTTTIAADPGADCAQGRPCEVSSGSVSLRPDTSYLVAVDDLDGCFPEGRFTLGEDCALEDPASVLSATTGSSTVQAGGEVDIQVSAADPTAAAPTEVSVRVAMLDEGGCQAEGEWSTTEVPADGSILLAAPARQGLALVCVGSTKHPTPVFITVSGTAPDAGQIQLAQVSVEGGIEVRPVLAPPEFSSFTWLVGPVGTTDCSTAEGYAPFAGEAALIEAADLPATVCVIAYDDAGTASTPTAFTVG